MTLLEIPDCGRDFLEIDTFSILHRNVITTKNQIWILLSKCQTSVLRSLRTGTEFGTVPIGMRKIHVYTRNVLEGTCLRWHVLSIWRVRLLDFRASSSKLKIQRCIFSLPTVISRTRCPIWVILFQKLTLFRLIEPSTIYRLFFPAII